MSTDLNVNCTQLCNSVFVEAHFDCDSSNTIISWLSSFPILCRLYYYDKHDVQPLWTNLTNEIYIRYRYFKFIVDFTRNLDEKKVGWSHLEFNHDK